MPRRISSSSQSSARRTGSRSSGDDAFVDEGEESARQRAVRRDTRVGTVAFDRVPRRHQRNSQINFFTIGEVGERLRVATRTVRRWIENGDLIVHRIGGVVRIAESDLSAFLALHREG